MRYYIILLNEHKVVDVCSYDNETAWLQYQEVFHTALRTHKHVSYDEVQTFTEK